MKSLLKIFSISAFLFFMSGTFVFAQYDYRHPLPEEKGVRPPHHAGMKPVAPQSLPNREDFERRLNDPDNRLSNLDLNNDGYVDFLRVVEVEEKGTHLVVIQAVIGDNLFQDVATVIVEGTNETSATVTIVGSRDIYGDNYVIVPTYVVRPVIFGWFWTPAYAVYHSAWYWGFYPSYYHRHLCWGYHTYHRHIHTWHTRHHNHCHFHRPKEYHHSAHHVEMHRGVGRNDYATHRPDAGYRKEPTPNRNLEARPVGGASNGTTVRPNATQQGRPAGSVSTSERNTNRTTNRTTTTKENGATRRPTATTLPARPTTSTTRSTSTTTTARPTTTTTRSTSSTTTARPSTSSTMRNTTTTTVRPTTTRSTSSTTTARQSTSSTTRNTLKTTSR